MKILVLSNLYPPDFIGGYELCCRQVVDALLARGHDVRVLTSSPRTPCPSADHVDRRFQLVNCYDAYDFLQSMPLTRDVRDAKARWVNAHNVHVLLDALREFAPDVVYLWNLLGLGGLGLMGCLQYLEVPWVWYLGDCVPSMLCRLHDEALPVLAQEFSRRVTGYYMPVSQRVVDEIETAGVRLNGRIEMAPNWVVGEAAPRRTRYYRPGEKLRIVSAGQMGRHKGIHLLIEAAALLRERGFENFSIDLFGRVSDESLAELPRRLEVERQVAFRGICSQEELVAHYERHEYDIFSFPTWEREPFGCAPLEAAAYGCAIVMTQSCGIGEWLVHDVHCLKTARTATSLADAFARILQGTIALEPIARRAAAVIWRDFHIDAILPRIESALMRAARRTNYGAESTPRGNGQSRGTRSVPAALADDAYRLALLAEKLSRAMIHEKYKQAA